jgi:hypothetical protein
VRGDEDRYAGGADTGEQVAQVLPQPDGFGDLPDPRPDLAGVAEEVVVRIHQH